uniref:Uncharacterized protein n=1 Tax=Glossina pallidipes TaxID=7398 RepID=A0A1A9ZW94_GLOPL
MRINLCSHSRVNAGKFWTGSGNDGVAGANDGDGDVVCVANAESHFSVEIFQNITALLLKMAYAFYRACVQNRGGDGRMSSDKNELAEIFICTSIIIEYSQHRHYQQSHFLMRQNGVTQQPMGMYINHRAEILLKVMSKVYPVIFGKKDTLEKFGTGSIMEKTLVSSSLGRCCA